MFRLGQATTASITLSLRVKPPPGARTLQASVSATDDVGNEGTATRLIRLR